MLGLTSLPCHPDQAGQVEAHWRGHWGMATRVHDVRDAIRRQVGWTNITDAFQHDTAAPLTALALIGVPMNQR